MKRIIFHIDVNNAFLSWTAIKLLNEGSNIDIREIPSVIGGDESSRHGIVLAKSPVAKKMGIKILDEEKILNDYLEEIRKKVPYKWWYFGHYHIDMDVENSSCLFERILSLGE